MYSAQDACAVTANEKGRCDWDAPLDCDLLARLNNKTHALVHCVAPPRLDMSRSANTSSILLATIVVLFLVAILEFKDASAAAVAADKKKKKAE